MAHIYFHIDLNAFFANAEILLDSELRGKPIAVAGTTRRSVVSTCSYEARAFGVHSAMPINAAMQLCPNLQIVQPHYSWYSELSKDFIRIIGEYTSEIEQASIDECYADVTEEIMKYEKPLDLAWNIQKRIYEELGLPCSIGVAPNMFLAKMASDMKKPMGITVLRLREVPSKLWPLPIEDMRGIGDKTVPIVKDLNIHTIGDLANFKDIDKLLPIFGKNTDSIIQRAKGNDDRTIIKEWDSKSMSVSETLLEDVTDYDELRGILRSLSRRLSKRMKEDHKLGNILSLRIKYYDFHSQDRSIKIEEPIWKSDDIFFHIGNLFDDNWNENPIRLLGIAVTGLTEVSGTVQMNLFDEEHAQKQETYSVLKELNHLLGGGKLIRASEMVKKDEN